MVVNGHGFGLESHIWYIFAISGIYAESHRHSKWLYTGDNEELVVFSINIDDKSPVIDSCDTGFDQSGDEIDPERGYNINQSEGGFLERGYSIDQSEIGYHMKGDQSQDSGLEIGSDLNRGTPGKI